MMVNYFPSKEDMFIKSKCLSLGFKCYPKAIKPGRSSLVVLEVDYNGRIIYSKEPAFEQKYIAYKVHQVYKQFYEKIKDKI